MSSAHSDGSSVEDLDTFIDDVLSGKVDYEQELRDQELQRIDQVKRAFMQTKVDRMKDRPPPPSSSSEDEEDDDYVLPSPKPKKSKPHKNVRGEDFASEESIKVLIQLEGSESLSPFFMSKDMNFVQFRKLVERQFGKLFALCFRHPFFDEDVEIDDDETFELFMERTNDGLILKGLINEPPPLHYNLPLWTAHECHAAYASRSKSLPPVDTIAAPHTLRAPAIFEDLKNIGIHVVRSNSPAHTPACCQRLPTPPPDDAEEESVANTDDINVQQTPSPIPGRRIRF